METIFGEVEILPSEKADETVKAIELFVNTSRELRTLDVPNREVAERLVNSALNLVARDLENRDLTAAKDVHDKLKAAEIYLKDKVNQLQADRLTQNTVAAGRYRVVRQIGKWCIDNVSHEQGRPKTIDNRYIKTNNLAAALVSLGIGYETYWRWMEIARFNERDFNDFLDLYLDDRIKQNAELYWSKLWSYVHPPDKKEQQEESIIEPSISLVSEAASVYRKTKELDRALQDMLVKVCAGNVPVSQVRYVFDQLNELDRRKKQYMIQMGELY